MNYIKCIVHWDFFSVSVSLPFSIPRSPATTIVVSFWPLNIFDITSFLNDSLLGFYEWFDVVRVPAQREPIFLIFDHNFVSCIIDVDDFEGLSQDSGIKLPRFLVISNADFVTDNESGCLSILRRVDFFFVFRFLLVVCFSCSSDVFFGCVCPRKVVALSVAERHGCWWDASRWVRCMSVAVQR